MQLVLSPNGKYLCAATDASRNIIIEVGTSNIVRDLYGHKVSGLGLMNPLSQILFGVSKCFITPYPLQLLKLTIFIL